MQHNCTRRDMQQQALGRQIAGATPGYAIILVRVASALLQAWHWQ